MSKEQTDGRHQITMQDLKQQHEHVLAMIVSRYNQKGWGISVSRHEIFGLLTEEWKELTDALRSNDTPEFYNELLDLAVAALHGMTSIDTGKMDW